MEFIPRVAQVEQLLMEYVFAHLEKQYLMEFVLAQIKLLLCVEQVNHSTMIGVDVSVTTKFQRVLAAMVRLPLMITLVNVNVRTKQQPHAHLLLLFLINQIADADAHQQIHALVLVQLLIRSHARAKPLLANAKMLLMTVFKESLSILQNLKRIIQLTVTYLMKQNAVGFLL